MNSSASSRARCELEQHVQDLRAHGDVEHRDRLVADRARPARAPARPRSPRAGAGRPRAGAGSGRGSAPASSPTSSSARATRAACSAFAHARAPRSGSATIVAHALARVQRLVGVLEDHLDAPAQRRAALALPPQLASPSSAIAPPAAGHQPEQRARQRRLAAARLPHDARGSRRAATRATRRRRARSPAPKWTARSRASISGRSPGLLRDQPRAAGQRSQGAKWQAADCAGRDLAQRRRPPGSASAAYGQRGRNAQPVGRVGRVGRPAGDRRGQLARAADHRQRVEQALRVRVLRRVEHRVAPARSRRSARRT